MVEYPEVWAKVESAILKRKNSMQPQDLIEIIKHFSNQGEGTEEFYDQVEKILEPSLSSMNAKQLVSVIQSFFNVRRGTQVFIGLAFKSLIEKIKEPDFKDVELLTKLSLILDEVRDIEVAPNELYYILEDKIMSLDDISPQDACLIANGFGAIHGSKELFDKLETIVAKHYSTMELEQLRLVFHGFVYNRRISKNLLKALRTKIIAFSSYLTPIDMAKLIRSYHLLHIQDKEVSTMLHNNLLLSLQNHSIHISNDDLYEIFLTMNITRTGSREMYKTLEYILNIRLPKIAEDAPLIKKFFAVVNKSGLVAQSTLMQMAKYV